MKTALTISAIIFSVTLFGQRVPNASENIDYLMTFGKQAPTSAGDDDHVQIFFFTVPESNEKPIYLRVYDPDIGSRHDEIIGSPNSKTRFSIYGGKGNFSEPDARQIHPSGNYKSGTLMASKIFGSDSQYDSRWYTFGPFNPLEGEKSEEVGGYVFKVIAEGVTGDDGNAYRYFLSVEDDRNVSVEGANAFGYEYTFKMPEGTVLSHIYPFIDKTVVSITQYNFDYDNEGEIMIYSVAKNRHVANISGNDVWASSKHVMTAEEKNTTVDMQMLHKSTKTTTMSVYITNQYNEPIPFFAIPIGGPPKYKYNLTMTYQKQ